MIHIKQDKSIKIPGGYSLFINFNYDPGLVSIVKQCTVKDYNKDSKVWEVPMTELSFILDEMCLYDDISISLLEDLRSETRENIIHEIGPFKADPFSYQRDGIEFGLNHDRWLLLDAPGLGKTLQIMYIAEELKKRENLEHCLIICGINTLKINWKKEIEKFSNLSCKILGERISKKGKYSIGSISDRLEDLKNKIDEFFVITNVETLRDERIIKEISKGKNNKFDMIVVDEIHKCKSPASEQGKGLLKLKNAKYKIGATGTLLLNNPLDAYVPLHWIGIENCTYTNFKYYYCIYSGAFNEILSGFRNMEILKRQIENCSLRRTKKELKEELEKSGKTFPEKTIIDEYLDMNDDQKIFYTNIVNGIKDQVDKVNLNTSTILSMVTRLRQATACPSILTSENISSTKIDRCCELAKEIVDNGDKVVIFSTFKDTLKPIFEKLAPYNPTINTGDNKDEEISKNIDDFQTSDRSKVFLATWQKMGTGITLTKASYAIFLDTPWTAAVYEQAQDRIHRIGSKEPVFIYNLICNNTIDERVKELVDDKEALSDYMIDGIITKKSLESLKKYINEL